MSRKSMIVWILFLLAAAAALHFSMAGIGDGPDPFGKGDRGPVMVQCCDDNGNCITVIVDDPDPFIRDFGPGMCVILDDGSPFNR